MHPNAARLQQLFTALDQHDHQTMASCYHPEASFRDIAFELRGKKQIQSMWHMICEGDIKAACESADANDRDGRATVVDSYTFGRSGPKEQWRPVRNVIESHFVFSDALILEQRDYCDARSWANQAIGGIKGLVAGRVRFLRARTAQEKLDAFVARHPEYQ
jgi:hypothetical protein